MRITQTPPEADLDGYDAEAVDLRDHRVLVALQPSLNLGHGEMTHDRVAIGVERTGVMIVESRPEGAAITLNGKVQDSETPARVQKLSPGPYAVRVEKPGYHAWEKTASIRSRETTFLNDIGLFRKTAAIRLR